MVRRIAPMAIRISIPGEQLLLLGLQELPGSNDPRAIIYAVKCSGILTLQVSGGRFQQPTKKRPNFFFMVRTEGHVSFGHGPMVGSQLPWLVCCLYGPTVLRGVFETLGRWDTFPLVPRAVARQVAYLPASVPGHGRE